MQNQRSDPSDPRIAQVLAHEKARCRALEEEDLAALALLLHDDLVHTHNNGRSERRADYLVALRERLRIVQCDRSALTVTLYGTVAVMAGRQHSRVLHRPTNDTKTMDAQVLQAWLETAPGRWQQLAFQSTLMAS